MLCHLFRFIILLCFGSFLWARNPIDHRLLWLRNDGAVGWGSFLCLVWRLPRILSTRYLRRLLLQLGLLLLCSWSVCRQFTWIITFLLDPVCLKNIVTPVLISKFLGILIVEKVATWVPHMCNIQHPFGFLQQDQPDSGSWAIFQVVLCYPLVCLELRQLLHIWSFLKGATRRCFLVS